MKVDNNYQREIILLPSCVFPLVKKNISNLNSEKNLKDLNLNLKNILEKVKNIKTRFSIIIADCSQNFNLSKNDLYSIDDFTNIYILNIKFSEEELKEISLRGKGYSEILMIKHSINILELPEDCIIHKLTARYSLIFPDLLLNYHSNLIKNNNFVILFSNFFQTTSCHFFSIRKAYLSKIIDQILERLNDYNGMILEKVFYLFIKKNNLLKKKVKRSRIFAYYKSSIKAGSSLARNGSSSYFYQFLRNIACMI